MPLIFSKRSKGFSFFLPLAFAELQVHRQSHVPDLGPDMLDVARKILVEPKDIVPNIKEVEEDERLKLMLDLMRRPGGWVHAEKDKLAALVKKMNTAAKSRSVMELCDAGVEFRAADDEVVTLSSINSKMGSSPCLSFALLINLKFWAATWLPLRIFTVGIFIMQLSALAS